MNTDALIDFILKFFKADDISKVNPFANLSIPTFEPAREVTKNIEMCGSEEGILLLPDGNYAPRKPYNRLPYNFNDVSVRTLLVRYVTNPTPDTIRICKIFEPISGQAQADEYDKALEAIGAPKGCAMEIPPNKEGQFNVFLIKENPNCIYLNDAFLRTFMHIDQSNLMNGIINIPPDVCGACNLPKEAIVFNDKGETEAMVVDYYVLVPKNHVLAWQLNIQNHWRLKKGWFSLDLVLNRDILYFIVANKTFDILRNACIQNWMTDKIDRRPLNQVGIKVLGGKGNVKVNVSTTFICFPHITPEMRKLMIPTLHPDFPRYADVVRGEILK